MKLGKWYTMKDVNALEDYGMVIGSELALIDHVHIYVREEKAYEGLRRATVTYLEGEMYARMKDGTMMIRPAALHESWYNNFVECPAPFCRGCELSLPVDNGVHYRVPDELEDGWMESRNRRIPVCECTVEGGT